MPAEAAIHLIGADWYQALGQPAIFTMRPADLHWQPLTNSRDGSYDSLALAWDMIHARGKLSAKTATHLFQTAERFAPFIQRRAIPMPLPADVTAAVQALLEIRDGLDIGFSLTVNAPIPGYAERDVWIVCAKLGLTFGPMGSFDWLSPGVPLPLVSVTPFGATDAFSLSGVQAGMHHPGLTIGFSLPLCAAPTQALQASFHIAATILRELGGDAFDQDDRHITPRIQEEYRTNLREALAMFSQTGMTTGSPEAVKIFGE